MINTKWFMKTIHCCLALIALSISTSALARQSCEWPFRTQIDVQSSNALSDYQVKFDLTQSSLSPGYDWSSDGDDLYIYDSDDSSLLEFWIDSWDSAAKTATVWVRFPTLAAGTRTIYFYYGNPNAPDINNAPFTFTYPGIKFHTRNSTSNPGNLTQAQTAFDQANDNNIEYGCSHITNFTGITNRSQFKQGSTTEYRTAATNFGAFSESYFYADETGTWQFRYGADFGRGGGLYVNGEILEEQWNDDLWWSNNWGNGVSAGNNEDEILRGSIYLTQGYHKLEVLGFEGGNDGGITVQFKRPSRPVPYADGWEALTTDNLNIHSRACPVDPEPTFSVIGHDVCEIDLGFDNTLSYPNAWVANDTRPVSFAIENIGTTHPSIPDTLVTVTLGAGLSLSSFTGTNWSCSVVSTTEVECLYSAVINQNGTSSSPVTLNIASTSDNSSASFSATVFSKQYEEQLDNNTISTTLPVWELDDDITPSCSVPKAGVFAAFYDTTGYPDNYADSEAEFDTWENDLAIRAKLDGTTIFNQINLNTGNPFNVRNSDYYLAILDGYIYVAEDGFYNFAVDGDDAVELKINNTVRSSYYGAHGATNGPVDENSIGLAKGFHKLDYRMQEYQGGDSFYAYWRQPSESVTTIIPASALFHCAGDADVSLSMTVDVQDDPNTAETTDKAIPGAVLRYSVLVKNEGDISTDGDSMELVQTLASDSILYVNNLTANGPVIFTDGTGNNISGLSYNFENLTSTTDGLLFSNTNGVDFNYQPTPDAEGFDSNVTDIKLVFSGSMKPKYAQGTPEFTIEYQVKIK